MVHSVWQRHIEVDVYFGPLQDKGRGDMVVCHSPVPLYPVGQVERAAAAAGLDLVWDPKNMSCIGTKLEFVDVLGEIQQWMMRADNLEGKANCMLLCVLRLSYILLLD